MLSKEYFYGEVWEPACGEGHISKVLVNHNYTVYSTDLIYRGYGIEKSIDFLKDYEDYDTVNCVITNPPFKLAQEFACTALKIASYKVALLCKLAFLEGVQRSSFLESSPLRRVLVFKKRLTMYRNGEPMENGGMIAFAWFIWEVGYKGPPEIGWL